MSCAPIGRGTPARSADYARPFAQPASAAIDSTGESAGPARHRVSGPQLAIFVHGCYWHHCPRCYPNLPKSNPEFWARKFELNRERDARKRRGLETAGWTVIEAWECDVRDRVDVVVTEVEVRSERRDREAISSR